MDTEVTWKKLNSNFAEILDNNHVRSAECRGERPGGSETSINERRTTPQAAMVTHAPKPQSAQAEDVKDRYERTRLVESVYFFCPPNSPKVMLQKLKIQQPHQFRPPDRMAIAVIDKVGL